MHNISIPVNGSKLRGWKHDFLEKSVGGCTSYDLLYLPWPDLTRSFFCQELRKGCPISYAKFQRDPPSGSEAIPEKLMGVASTPPLPLQGRGLNIGHHVTNNSCANYWLFKQHVSTIADLTASRLFFCDRSRTGNDFLVIARVGWQMQ